MVRELIKILLFKESKNNPRAYFYAIQGQKCQEHSSQRTQDALHPNKETLRQSEAKFQTIFEYSPIGIALIDKTVQVVDINPALCQILGYNREEVCGRSLSDFIDDKIEEYLNSQQRLEIERCLPHKSGQSIWVQLSVFPLPSENKQPELFFVIVKDINEHKQTELRLCASSQAKSEILATMSHELRTPLHAIIGLSQLLQKEIAGSLNEKQKEYVNYIYNNGKHLLALVNDFLDLSKIEAGKEELQLLTLQVHELCQYVISTVYEHAEQKGLQLTVEIDEQADTCIADERRVKQMLLNLLSNAIKFTPEGQVSLEVKKVQQGISFIVSDTGIGIAPSQFQFLFEPFKQLDSQWVRQCEGTGLGLALTRKLARLHGGDVFVESSLGAGSRFTLFLPDQPLI